MKKYLLLLLVPFLFVLSPVKAETNQSGTWDNEASTRSFNLAEGSIDVDKDEYTRNVTVNSSSSGNQFFLDPERDKDFTLMMTVVTIIAILLHIASFVTPIIFIIVLVKRIRKVSKDGMAAQSSEQGTEIKESLAKSNYRKDESAASNEESSHFDSPFE